MKKITIALFCLLNVSMLASFAYAEGKCPRDKPYYSCDKTGCRCLDYAPGIPK
jgi:hypothetical protein